MYILPVLLHAVVKRRKMHIKSRIKTLYKRLKQLLKPFVPL